MSSAIPMPIFAKVPVRVRWTSPGRVSRKLGMASVGRVASGFSGLRHQLVATVSVRPRSEFGSWRPALTPLRHVTHRGSAPPQPRPAPAGRGDAARSAASPSTSRSEDPYLPYVPDAALAPPDPGSRQADCATAHFHLHLPPRLPGRLQRPAPSVRSTTRAAQLIYRWCPGSRSIEAARPSLISGEAGVRRCRARCARSTPRERSRRSNPVWLRQDGIGPPPL
jgi:hypothetical protein